MAEISQFSITASSYGPSHIMLLYPNTFMFDAGY